MKRVLISVQPKWCELITSGKKTVEVRKTKPKLETPFKVYIYCTQNELLTKSHNNGKIYVAANKKYQNALERNGNFTLSGKVIGEFVCDEILDCRDVNMDDTCITVGEWLKYTKGHKGAVYAWHISSLVIYDKPRKLGEFAVACDGVSGKIGCRGCKYYYEENDESQGHFEMCGCDNLRPLTRPPQSWCYVENIK